MPRGKKKESSPEAQAQAMEVQVTQEDVDRGEDTPTDNPLAIAIKRAVVLKLIHDGAFGADENIDVEIKDNQVNVIARDWARLGVDLDEEAVIWLCNWKVGNEMGPTTIKLPELV